MSRFANGIGAVALALVVSSCGGGSSSGPASNQGSGTLEPPAVGFQLASTPVTLAAGEEQYFCWSAVLPADAPLSIVATQAGLPKTGVHHYAVFTKSGAVPDNPTAYDCKVMDATWGLVTGGGVGTSGLSFPQGTAMTLAAGTQVVLQLHLLNPGSSALTVPVAAVNLVGSKAPNLQAVGLLIAGTLNIDVPAHQSGVNVNGGCAAPWAMPNIFAVFPHMHTLGTHISMSLTSPPTAPQMLIDRDWDFGNQGVYLAQGSAAQGDQVGVQCTFSNPTDTDVHFGESTHDEMCLGVLYYYPAPQLSQYCGLE